MAAIALPHRGAAALGYFNCQGCELLCRMPAGTRPGQGELSCPRCGVALQARKPASLQRTWAFLIAAVLLYVPANLWPILHSNALFKTQSDTIMSGVVYLWITGSWPLAMLVFVASIVVPGLKIACLALLVLSVQWRMAWRPRQRTRLYRLVDFIGRWSMLDIYVVALSVALVQVPAFASAQPGPGALAFAAVVVFTMLASISFDPRLIWDQASDPRARGAQGDDD